ncbi:MAG: DUF488 domain-containing protein [Desulfomonilia bacterium]
MKTVVHTIGHSTRTIEEFVALLQEYGIEMVIDVRRIARSRRNPHFNEDVLREALKRHSIEYRRMEGLGGLRRAAITSVNRAWKNPSFRGYADYMQTPAFAENMEELIGTAGRKQTVIMCAEAVPWRCHRSLIGDALVVRGIHVEDILGSRASRPHKLTPFALVDGTTIIYPATT